MALSDRLGRYICSQTYENLPEKVKSIAISCVYNYMGCVYSGSIQPPPVKMLRMLESYFPAGKCHVLGTDRKADPATAALINGTSANSMGFDDMYKDGIYHPGIPAITGALTIADIVPVTGKEFITAVVLGYEIANRIARTCNPSHYKYWHTAATVGSFGSAASAAKALKLTLEETIFALGIAGTKAAGLQECNGNMAQRFHLGTASANGVLAALMAKSGVNGPRNILDGPAGFFAAMSKFDGDVVTAFEDLGDQYTILDTTFKFYPCCGHIHACIDAAIDVMETNALSCQDIKKVKVGTYKTAIVNSGNPAPQDVLQAKFSIAYCVAAGMLHKQVTVSEFANWPPSSAITELMKKIELSVDPVCEENFFAGKRGGVVTVHTTQGTFTATHYSRKGDPDCPLSRQDIVNKFRELAEMVISADGVRELGSYIEQLPELMDVSVLAKSYGKVAP